MKANPIAEKIIYWLVVFLSVTVVIFIAISPPDLMNTAAVYQGF
jgi:hypothetical protein